MEKGTVVDAEINLAEIYNARTNVGDGMTYKSAFDFLTKKGVHSKEKIESTFRMSIIILIIFYR